MDAAVQNTIWFWFDLPWYTGAVYHCHGGTTKEKDVIKEEIMWIADRWKDYEVIDTSDGEKLERWGEYILVRPDPQVIWNTEKKHFGWKKPNGHYHRSNKGGGEWEFHKLPEEWTINYKDLTFNLKPFSFKHTGLFPEQATNWDWFSSIINKEIKEKNLNEN